MFSKLCPV